MNPGKVAARQKAKYSGTGVFGEAAGIARTAQKIAAIGGPGPKKRDKAVTKGAKTVAKTVKRTVRRTTREMFPPSSSGGKKSSTVSRSTTPHMSGAERARRSLTASTSQGRTPSGNLKERIAAGIEARTGNSGARVQKRASRQAHALRASRKS